MTVLAVVLTLLGAILLAQAFRAAHGGRISVLGFYALAWGGLVALGVGVILGFSQLLRYLPS